MQVIALNNLKAADLKAIAESTPAVLGVSLKGYVFHIRPAVGGVADFTCDDGAGRYPFSAISDLKEFVRNCVAAYQEEADKAPEVAPKDFSKVGSEACAKLVDKLQAITKCPSVSDLAYQVTEQGNLFFTKKTMKFFGDTLGNYGTRMVQQQDGSWIIELFRKRPVKHNTSSSAYFDAVTFKRLHSVTLKDGQ